MKNVTETKVPAIQIDKRLNKYDDVVLFPEKVQKAKEMLRTVGLPKELLPKK